MMVAHAAPATPKQNEPTAPPAARPAGAKPFRRQMPVALESMSSFKERTAANEAIAKAKAEKFNEVTDLGKAQPEAQAEDKKDE